MSVPTTLERDQVIDRTFSAFQLVQRAETAVDVVRAIENAPSRIGIHAVILLDRHLYTGRLPDALHLDRGRYVLNHLATDAVVHDPVVQHMTRPRPSVWSLAEYDRPANRAVEDFRDEIVAQGVSGGLAVPMFNPAGLRGAAVWSWGQGADAQCINLWLLNALSSVALDRIEAQRRTARETAADLSPRERDCLLYTAEGLTGPQIAAVLGLSERTVEAYLRTAALKLGANSRPQAIAAALRRGLLT